jgi:hypothetical protein
MDGDMNEDGTLNDQQIAKRVRIIQTVYLIYACGGAATTIYILLGLSQKHPPKETVDVAFALWTCLFAYYSLKKRKDWAVPLLLVIPAAKLFYDLAIVLSPVEDLEALLGKTVDAGSALFCLYQIVFFQKQEVRNFFGSKGKVII